MSEPEIFSVFIMKNSSSSLRAAESYLKNRKWIVGSSHNLREALAYIIQKKPVYILISADHANKKVKILPQLLAQAFPVKIVVFTEGAGPSAMQQLRELNQPYVLFPPVSGPAIERIVLKIKKDLEQEAEDRKQAHVSGGGNPGDQLIRFKGDVTAEEGQNTFEMARAALSRLASAKDDDDSIQGAAYTPDHQAIRRPDGGSITQEGPGLGESFAQWEERMKKGALLSAESGSNNSDLLSARQDGPRTSPQVPIMESDYIAKKKAAKTLYVRGNEAGSQGLESIVVKGAVEALDQTVIEGDSRTESDIIKVESTSNIACIIVESARFSGYLVAALGNNRKIDRDFMETIKKRLFSFLKANGEPVKDDDSMGIKIKEVAFEAWALEQAEFLRKSVHEGNEIAMAFFPHSEANVKLEDSASEKMVQISVSDLKEDVALEFDLYMYLPENNRYLLYTPQGMPLYGKQKDRLETKGITHMHLKRESANEVKKYRAQNYLNEKIEAYKAAQKIKAGV